MLIFKSFNMKKQYLFFAFSIILLSVFSACSSSDETPEEELILEIGQEYQGGKIFYIDETGHGLIAHTADLGLGDWGCFYNDGSVPDFEPPTEPIAQNDGIGFGMQNTLAILNFCGDPDIAARLASNLDVNGYNDWYLPSIDELELVYQHRDLIGGFPDLDNDPIEDGFIIYASSSEGWATNDGYGGFIYLNYQVYDFSITTALPNTRNVYTSKSSEALVRPIRSF